MTQILALWATPRSVSTAFEWMMRQRGDFICHHEPFGEAWYYGEDRRCPRETKESPRAGLSFDSVWRTLQADAAKGRVFMKEFPHYVDHMADDRFWRDFSTPSWSATRARCCRRWIITGRISLWPRSVSPNSALCSNGSRGATARRRR